MSLDLWNRYCEYFRSYPEVGLSIDISRMKFPDSFFAEMAEKIQNAFAGMDGLEHGEIANPDEGWMVGHYWLRNPGIAPSKDDSAAILSSWSDIKAFAADIHQGKIRSQSGEAFKNILFLGIGGSALGPQLVCAALRKPNPDLNIYFLDNTDPDGIYLTLAQLSGELARSLVVVVSKSGGTVETRNDQIEVERAFIAAGLDFAKHAVAITCANSKLDTLARNNHWLKQFPLWSWVGGRTSVFSAAGLLPGALTGVDIDAFIDGARTMDQITRKNNAMANPAMLLALMWYYIGEGLGKKDLVVLPYKDRLLLLSRHLQQLIMESLGKEFDLKGNVVNQGLSVFGNKGSTDQHAYVQQLREGLDNFFVTFIEVLKDNVGITGYDGQAVEVEPGITSGDYLQGFMLGTRAALYEKGRQSITVTLEQLDARSMGSLIALFERTVGFYASLIGINAYHQPGVEAGKKAAGGIIDIQKKILGELAKINPNEELTAVEVSKKIGKGDDVELVFRIMEHLAANNRGISAVSSGSPATKRYKRS